MPPKAQTCKTNQRNSHLRHKFVKTKDVFKAEEGDSMFLRYVLPTRSHNAENEHGHFKKE